MRSLNVAICTLALVSLVFAAPTAQNNASDCSADGTCGDDNSVETNDKRSIIGDNFDFFECFDDNDGEITVTTTTSIAETAVAFQLTPTPASAPHTDSDGGSLLGLGGLLGGLLGSSNHNSAPAGLPLTGLTNGNPVDDLTHHLIDLDLDATASVGDLLQATATATLGLL